MDKLFLLLAAVICISQASVVPQSQFAKPYRTDAEWEEALARAIEVLESYPLVDGHNDLPWVYRRRIENNIEGVNLTYDVNDQWGDSHTDIPRLREGRLGAQFWSVYMTCAKQYKDAVRATMEQVDVARRMIAEYPDDFAYVTTAEGIEQAFEDGKIGGLMGIEGGHQIDSSLAALRMFYELGVRYMTLTHSCTLPWADASPEDENDTPTHNGLTAWGKLLIKEMNRMGMLVDLSHVSKPTMMDTLDETEAPIIFSHSNAWALCQHHRNVQDDVLARVAENNGIVMVTFVQSFLGCHPSENKAMNVSLVADHIEHIVEKAGHDHVGIGGDYDGMSGGPEGLEDVTGYPNLFAELVLRGWSNEDLEKLAGRNLVRVFKDVESVRDRKALEGEKARNDWIPQNDLDDVNQCRTLDPEAPPPQDNSSVKAKSTLTTLFVVAISWLFLCSPFH